MVIALFVLNFDSKIVGTSPLSSKNKMRRRRPKGLNLYFDIMNVKLCLLNQEGLHLNFNITYISTSRGFAPTFQHHPKFEHHKGICTSITTSPSITTSGICTSITTSPLFEHQKVLHLNFNITSIITSPRGIEPQFQHHLHFNIKVLHLNFNIT